MDLLQALLNRGILGDSSGGGTPSGGGTDLASVDVFVGDYLSTTELTITTGAVDRYQRYIVGA